MDSSSIPFMLLKWPVLLLCLLCHSCSAGSNSCHPADLRGLTEFAGNLTAGKILSLWPFSDGGNGNGNVTSCCGWTGVFCARSAALRVTELRLPGSLLCGTLSASLANLGQLRVLDLSGNFLTGCIPPELSLLRRLELLDLSFNSLSRMLTPVAGMTALRYANLSSNAFEGTLLDLGANLPSLLYLNISNNSLAGGTGPDLCIGSALLRTIDLSDNLLSGQLKGHSLSNCSALREMNLDSNSLSGNLPDSLFSLLLLERLSLASNAFNGSLGERLGQLSSLKSLVISGNRLHGALPDVFHKMASFEELTAHTNLLSGSLPQSLSLCSMLKGLDLRNNSITGPIDLDFSGMPLLSSLDLATNHLTGPLPPSLSGCSELKTLSLAKNGLSGEIPDGFGNLLSLSFLSLSNNSFRNMSGALSVLQRLENLTTLILTRNFHDEEVPSNSIRFANLTIFAVGNCGLRGQIPRWLTECKKLQVLDLSWNRLSGTIPSWIGDFENLFYLDISNNSLAGEIPKSLTQLKSLVSTQVVATPMGIVVPLYVKRNQSTCGLQYNQLSSFPPALLLNDNGIIGTIWPEFGHLKELHVLDLSNNNITGSIPDTLCEMENLEVLDLSYNGLNGTIPKSLSKLTFLSKFSVAHNRLVGEIPSGGQFFSFSNSSFEDNVGLGMLGNGRPPSPRSNPEAIGPAPVIPLALSNKIGKNSILGITIGIGLGIAFLVAVVLISIPRRVVGDAAEDDDVEERPHGSSDSVGSKLVMFFQSPESKEMIINDLLRSTNNFDQANIIGCGGFGLVYKACLPDGTKAAIKRLSGDCGQMEREFRAEVEALSRAQHKNLVSLKGYCRHGNDRLLIYTYMENGSLDYWLHERVDGGSSLRWESRLKIAQGSARGLAYLHKICEPNIIHRDVKTSNILLDDRFEAHLADFGLSRLIRPYDTHVTTDLVGTLGYIPPEYSQTLIATTKGDVYSFGVVLLELLTGRRPVDVCKAKGCRDLVSWVLGLKYEKKEEQIFDPLIWSKAHEKQLLVVLETACRCISPEPRHRPSIEQVVLWLDGVAADN